MILKSPWKIQLTVATNFMSSRGNGVCDAFSDNIGLETSMKDSDFNFD